jgi:hypothetical protein
MMSFPALTEVVHALGWKHIVRELCHRARIHYEIVTVIEDYVGSDVGHAVSTEELPEAPPDMLRLKSDFTA